MNRPMFKSEINMPNSCLNPDVEFHYLPVILKSSYNFARSKNILVVILNDPHQLCLLLSSVLRCQKLFLDPMLNAVAEDTILALFVSGTFNMFTCEIGSPSHLT